MRFVPSSEGRLNESYNFNVSMVRVNASCESEWRSSEEWRHFWTSLSEDGVKWNYKMNDGRIFEWYHRVPKLQSKIIAIEKNSRNGMEF